MPPRLNDKGGDPDPIRQCTTARRSARIFFEALKDHRHRDPQPNRTPAPTSKAHAEVEAPQQLPHATEPWRRRDLSRQRIDDVCDDAGAVIGWAGSEVRRLRRWHPRQRLESGAIDALVVQDPVKMGYLAVKTLVAHIKGEPVEKRIDTGVHLATQANMNEPEMKELLRPDLSKWLK